MEIWKEIEGYNGLYLISSHGRVMSLFANKQKIINHHKTPKGYLVIGLCNNTISKNHKVHRLVAQAFIPNPLNKPQVNHKDLNKTNNNVDNLEWVTGYENYIHAVANGAVRQKSTLQKKIKIPKPLGKKIYVYSISGQYMKEETSIKSQSASLGVSLKVFSSHIKSTKPIGKYRYSFQKAQQISQYIPKQAPKKPLPKHTENKAKRPILMTTESGFIIAYFESIIRCAETKGLRAKSISNVLNGYKKSHGGYHFRYAKFPLY